MSFVITDEELSALYGLPHAAQLLYFRELRPRMDFKSGLVGGDACRISWRSIGESIEVHAHQGIKSESFNKSRVKRLMQWLEKSGLVKQIGDGFPLIFLLPMANTHQSAKNKADPKPTQSRPPKADPNPTPIYSEISEGYTGVDDKTRTTTKIVETPKADPHQISDIRSPLTGGRERSCLAENHAPKQQPQQAKKSTTRGARLPLTDLPGEWRTWSLQTRPDLEPELVWDCFRDYWVAKTGQAATKRDWFATWRNWVRRERSVPAGSKPGSNTKTGSKVHDWLQDDKTIDGESEVIGYASM